MVVVREREVAVGCDELEATRVHAYGLDPTQVPGRVARRAQVAVAGCVQHLDGRERVEQAVDDGVRGATHEVVRAVIALVVGQRQLLGSRHHAQRRTAATAWTATPW